MQCHRLGHTFGNPRGLVRPWNLLYLMLDIKCVCSTCTTCAKLKPKFYRPDEVGLVRATQPWERICLDFKGPLESSTRMTFLTVVDEYSRFLFAFPCADVSTSTVIHMDVSTSTVSIFDLPGYVHTDWGVQLYIQGTQGVSLWSWSRRELYYPLQPARQRAV